MRRLTTAPVDHHQIRLIIVDDFIAVISMMHARHVIFLALSSAFSPFIKFKV